MFTAVEPTTVEQIQTDDDTRRCTSNEPHKCDGVASWALGPSFGFPYLCVQPGAFWCETRFRVYMLHIKWGNVCHYCKRPIERCWPKPIALDH